MRKDKAQIYGTQYTKMSNDAPWKLYKIDTTQITPAQRSEYGVPTLAQQRQRVKEMNKKSLDELLEDKSISEVVDFIKSEDLETSEYNLSEMAINSLGYQLMNSDKQDEALKILKLNTQLYPNAYNTWDSYGEILLAMGEKKKARKAYEKSIQINPENKNGKDILAKMEYN